MNAADTLEILADMIEASEDSAVSVEIVIAETDVETIKESASGMRFGKASERSATQMGMAEDISMRVLVPVEPFADLERLGGKLCTVTYKGKTKQYTVASHDDHACGGLTYLNLRSINQATP